MATVIHATVDAARSVVFITQARLGEVTTLHEISFAHVQLAASTLRDHLLSQMPVEIPRTDSSAHDPTT